MGYDKIMLIKMQFSQKALLGIFIILAILVSFTSCYSRYEKEYYSNIDNFVTSQAKIENIIYVEDDEYLVMWLSETDEVYTTKNFIVEGDNLKIVLENNILEKLKINDNIIFTSAPRIFGNGYFLPLVEIKFNDESILEFSDGYNNLMNSY